MMASSAVGTKRRTEDSERAPAIAGVGLLANSTQCLIGGVWVSGAGPVIRELRSPIDSNHIIAKVQEASPEQVDEACVLAAKASRRWAATPPAERARVMFKAREIFEEHVDELAEMVVRENGKTMSEARGEVRRGIDMIEYACGIPSLLMGRTLPDVSHNVDTYSIREPLGGVVAASGPFNFPCMIVLWSLPIALACGNGFVLKPSDRCPTTGTRVAELFMSAGLPPGLLAVVQGGQAVGERLMAHPAVAAITFVGSSPVAAAVYRGAAAQGKRCQALGGAKNCLVVMPDADLSRAIPALVGSCFGCAGQRCLAGSVLVPVGSRERQDAVVAAFVTAAAALRLGSGLDRETTLPPLYSVEHRDRVAEWVGRAVADGAKLVLDGRALIPLPPGSGLDRGAFLGACVLDECTVAMPLVQTEVFGPVVAVVRAATLDDAIAASNSTAFGNSASLFTGDGAAVRTFRARIQAGMLGINLGVPAPFAAFSFGGWKGSLYGDLHGHGPDAIEFFTRKKVVTERWFGAEAPKDGWV